MAYFSLFFACFCCHRCDLVAFYAEWCGFTCREPAHAGFCLVTSSGDAAGTVFKRRAYPALGAFDVIYDIGRRVEQFFCLSFAALS